MFYNRTKTLVVHGRRRESKSTTISFVVSLKVCDELMENSAFLILAFDLQKVDIKISFKKKFDMPVAAQLEKDI